MAMDQAEKPQDCQTCHRPRHSLDLGLDCQRCHSLSLVDGQAIAFKAARSHLSFDHRETGFALERRHNVLACTSCHPASAPPPRTACASCHADPHAGQLGMACEDCHKADRFRLARFDHDRAGWPLRGKHFVTPCINCHTNQRWIGLTTDCYDCHALDAARGKAIVPGPHLAVGAGKPFIDCKDCHHSLWTWRQAN
jgi:hypothetical protein